MTLPRIAWRPHQGMQVRALEEATDELFIGGAKGPGKSDVLVVKATRQVHLEGYKGLLLRETFPELQELIDRSHRLYPKLRNPPAWSGELRRWTWPNRTVVKFGYCSRREDVQSYQGGEWAFIGFDEVGNHRDPRTWLDLLGENRCPNPEVLTQCAGSGNPGFAGHMWTKRRFVDTCGKDGERIHQEQVELPDGRVLYLSRAFVPGKVWENPIYANSAAYMGRLASLPEVLRRQRLYGDYDAGTGAALDELDSQVHFCKPFPVPSHWPMFAGFDWGYRHWWVFVVGAVTEDGKVYITDTIKGRMQKPWEIAQRIKRQAPLGKIQRIDAGHDVQAKRQAEGQDNPSLRETFAGIGIPLSLANVDRQQGLQQCREFVKWRGCGPEGRDAEPAVQFFETEGNRWLFSQLEDMVVDPDDVETVLKVDADPDTGEGGDDGFDAWRYLMMGRPLRARWQPETEQVQPWAPATLAAEARIGRTVHIDQPEEQLRSPLDHPEMGDAL